MSNLQGKTVVITGGNSGMGYATAKKFRELGASVIITGRHRHAVDEAAATLGVTGVVADQADLEAIDVLVSQVKESLEEWMCSSSTPAWLPLPPWSR